MAKDKGMTTAKDKGMTTAKDKGMTTAKDKGMTPAEYNQNLGLVCGRNPHHASGGAFQSAHIPTVTFLFYIMMGGNPFLLVLMGSLPIVEHNPTRKMSEADAALEALLARGLVRPGTVNPPTVIHPISRLFGKPDVIYFVQVDDAELAPQGHSLLGSKVYSLVDPKTGKTRGEKDASILGFGAAQYAETKIALLRMLSSAPPPSLVGFARGGDTVALPKSTRFGGSAAHSSPSHGHSSRLTKVDKMGVVRHVFCMFLLDCGSFLLVQGTDSNWGPPGGDVEKGETSWDAVKREVLEETKSNLPKLDGQPLGSTTHEPLKFHWAHLSSTSGFYCGSTTSSYHDFSRNFRKSKEIIGIGGFTVKELWQMVNVTHADFTLRPCAIESTRALLIALGFPERS
jgi:ADP-ribose pyrophosphatase YjhB (NUDIX family)